jgi:transcription elongation GreA/GreB family factor
MSRAFVKERDDESENLTERPISTRENYVTSEGLAAIGRALAKFEAARVAAIAKDNKTAVELTARELRYWSARRLTAVVMPRPEANGLAQFGSSVTVRRGDGRVQSFRIVGEDEADPSTGTVSYASPFAQAVLGKRAGEIIEIADQESEILSVDYP